MAHLRVLREAEPGLGRALREAEVRQRWSYHVEARRVVVGGGGGQEGEDLGDFEEAAGPFFWGGLLVS